MIGGEIWVRERKGGRGWENGRYWKGGRERERELLCVCSAWDGGRGHRGVVFVCHENPADAAHWGSETKLKGVIPCVFREIAHSSLIMYFSYRKTCKLTQTPSTKPASCSHKGKAGREKRNQNEFWESDFCDMLNVWKATGDCNTIQFAVLSQ